jgi:hypothetical protein
MPPKVAAITMAYNEAVLLPLWGRHYVRQVGADHCYVIDHGSHEPLHLPPGVNVLRLPRSPHDDPRRAAFISQFAASLLKYYDWIIHTDVDELVLADPQRYPDLPSFCAAAEAPTITAIGLDVQHVPALEAPLNPKRPVGEQRGWVRFTSAMCKPVLSRQAQTWAPGFHCSDQRLVFDQLYLFHLHWADRDLGLQRLAKTRAMPWGDPSFGAHQRVTDSEWRALFDGMASFPAVENPAFDPSLPPLQPWLQRVEDSVADHPAQNYKVDLHMNGAELWAIPPRFRARL